MVKKSNVARLFLILVIPGLFLAGCQRSDLLAKVGKIEIKTSEVETIVNRLKAEHPGFFERRGFEEEVRKKVIKGLITGALIENNLDYLGLKVTDQEIKAEINKYKKFYGKKFSRALKNFGFTEEGFRYSVFRSLLFRKAIKLVEKDIKPVTSEEVEAYYQKHKDDFVVEPRYRLLLAQISSSQKAKKVEKELKKKKADFPQLVSQFNLCPLKNQDDFDTGWKEKSELPLAVYKKVEKLKVGQVLTPFKIGEDWCLVKLIDKEEKRLRPFAEVKDYINNLLYQRHKEEAWGRLIKKLEKRTPVKSYQKI